MLIDDKVHLKQIVKSTEGFEGDDMDVVESREDTKNEIKKWLDEAITEISNQD